MEQPASMIALKRTFEDTEVDAYLETAQRMGKWIIYVCVKDEKTDKVHCMRKSNRLPGDDLKTAAKLIIKDLKDEIVKIEEEVEKAKHGEIQAQFEPVATSDDGGGTTETDKRQT